MRDATKGVLAMILACTVWGLSPLYYALLTHVPPLEVLSFRGLWSLLFFAVILMVQGRLREVRRVVVSKQVLLIALAAIMISANWFGFIFSIQAGRAMEASLGYYIFPLAAVLLGWIGFREALGGAQWIAIILAAIAVITLTGGLGAAPWIAIGLAGTFAIYGVVKKQLAIGPVVSVTAEVFLLAPFAAGYLIWFGDAAAWTWQTYALLALSGPLTATPLVLFSYAARRVQMSTVGVVQYVNPTLQFSVAVFAFSEVFTPWHGIAFPMIWTALAIYSIAAIRHDRAARRSASRVATSDTVVTNDKMSSPANP